MPKKIIRVDASALKGSACMRRLFLTCVEGYRSPKESNDLLYGTCFHKCVEVFAKTGNQSQAFMEAVTHWDENIEKCEVKYNAKYLNKEHLISTLMRYFLEARTNDIFTRCSYFKLGKETLAECKISIPMYSDSNVDILLQGTIDGIFQIEGGCPCIGDWKTTRAKNPADYFYGYKMSTQLRTYFYAVTWYLENMPEHPLAVAFKSAPRLGTFIFGAFLSSDGVQFQRSQIFPFSKADMFLYERLMRKKLGDLLEAYENFRVSDGKVYPHPEGMINGACQEVFGSYCSFYDACSSSVGLGDNADPLQLFEAILNNRFTKRDYTPLDFGGGKEKKLSV